VILRVRATPGARKESVTLIRDGVYEIAVREKAERGDANSRIRALLAKELGVTAKKLRLISGQTSRSKTYELL
jgi:uncharacterized protein YggU (UPF0235/DUF167 family)